jgi:hypothetical protein
VTRVEVTTSDPLKVVLPPEVKGAVRDFFVRLVITSDELPEISFAAPSGETISFEDADEDVLSCEIGVNVFAFTETDAGIFMINRKQIDIDQEVEFDPCGGVLDKTKYTFKLGAKYSTLPKPVMSGMVFDGWFTAAEGGIQVQATDRCKTGVTKLYAQWSVYVDPFVDALCDAKNMTFFSESAQPWTVDASTCLTPPGSARSGAIGDNGSTVLKTTVVGKGTLEFMWHVSSESGYDWLSVIVDGTVNDQISGSWDPDWHQKIIEITTEGSHTIEWKYSKDGSCSDGSDCGWIDNVSWTPAEA